MQQRFLEQEGAEVRHRTASVLGLPQQGLMHPEADLNSVRLPVWELPCHTGLHGERGSAAGERLRCPCLTEKLGGLDMKTMLKIDAEQAQGAVAAQRGDGRH